MTANRKYFVQDNIGQLLNATHRYNNGIRYFGTERYGKYIFILKIYYSLYVWTGNKKSMFICKKKIQLRV